MAAAAAPPAISLGLRARIPGMAGRAILPLRLRRHSHNREVTTHKVDMVVLVLDLRPPLHMARLPALGTMPRTRRLRSLGRTSMGRHPDNFLMHRLALLALPAPLAPLAIIPADNINMVEAISLAGGEYVVLVSQSQVNSAESNVHVILPPLRFLYRPFIFVRLVSLESKVFQIFVLCETILFFVATNE